MIYTTRVRLLAQEGDSLGYTTYVFDVLDNNEVTRLGSRYIMCTKFPNWDHREMYNGEEGFLTFKEVEAGKDTWFNGNTFVPYNYTGIHFIKFVNKQVIDKNHEYKL
jgi:hypothetical protein